MSASLARPLWDLASSRGDGPAIFELGACDCSSGHACHVERVLRPVSEEYVISSLWDMVCLPSAVAVGVWTRTAQPAGAQLLLVVAGEDVPVALVGRVGGEPQVLEARSGELYVAALAALQPVPADDPLVVELTAMSEGDE